MDGRSLICVPVLLLMACGGPSAAPDGSGGPSPVAAASIAPAAGTATGASAAPSANAGQPAVSTARAASPTGAPASASPAPSFARGSVAIRTKAGPVALGVEIADDEAKREYGLMNRGSLPADSGMLFVFQPPALATQIGFWMKDTLIPLSIAFVEPNLNVESLQDMQPLDEQIHYAPRDYSYAIEANLGWFSNHGVSVGDTVNITR